MIQIKQGDVIAIKQKGHFYYAIILSRIIYFGGNLVYAFHTKSDNLLTLKELIHKETRGFNAIVDFIFAKREKRITKLGQIENLSKYREHKYYKATHQTRGKAEFWFVSSDDFKEVKRTEQLSEDEKEYPLRERIDDKLMIDKINNFWLPELDERI
jgi:hypothetical protein